MGGYRPQTVDSLVHMYVSVYRLCSFEILSENVEESSNVQRMYITEGFTEVVIKEI